MKHYLLPLFILSLLNLTGCGGGGTSNNSPIYSVNLEFQRVINVGGLDPFTVTATIQSDGEALIGVTPTVELDRGTHGGITDHGDGRYSFTVTPNQTGEHRVTVNYSTASHSETALVLKSVDAGWGQPMAVSGLVNTEGYEDGLSITKDGEFLFVQTGPIYFSAIFYFNDPNGCNGNRLSPSRCTHPWIDSTIGPTDAPERPGYFNGRFTGTTLRHNSNLWNIGDEMSPIYAPITMFYGFRRQQDGSYREPFYLAFDDQNDAIANPFGLSLRVNDDGTAEAVFALDDPSDTNVVDHNNDGIFDQESYFDIYTAKITLGIDNSLGVFDIGLPPTPGVTFPTKLDFGDIGTDGIYGTQGNPHLYFSGDGTIKSIWTDDEYDLDAAKPSNNDQGDISVYVLSAGSFPGVANDWSKVILPAKVNLVGDQIQPFFTGQGLYFTQDVDIYYAHYTGSDTAIDYANNNNWGSPVRLLEKDVGISPQGKIVAIGEPNIAYIDGEETLFFVYVVVRGEDEISSTGLADLNMQTGYVKKVN